MPWFLAFVGFILASVIYEEGWLGGLIGFVIGHYISVGWKLNKIQSSDDAAVDARFADLDAQLKQLQLRISLLEGRLTTPDEIVTEVSEPAAKQPGRSIADVASEPAVFKLADEQPEAIVESSPAVAQAESTATLSDAVTSQNTIALQVEIDPKAEQFQANAIDKAVQFIWAWFTDGNTFVRVGIIILFVGVSFLLNFAIDRGFISIELRLAAVAAFALAMLVVGWKLQLKRGAYALLVQGGAVGLLYLTIFASFSLYQVLPSGAAFFFLIVIVILSTTLAVLQNALSLVLFAVIGGFLAPILTSTGSNNYIGLFSFYLLLNAGILAVAWFRAWKVLNLVGFFFTFSIASFWGMSRYQPENFASVEPFLILSFLFYVGIGVLYATRRASNAKDYVDGTLIFGTPIIAFAMQAGMVSRFEYGVAISAVVMGLFYLALSAWCWRHYGAKLRFLTETLLAVAVIFATMAVPFAVDAKTTSSIWAIEATGVLWVSIHQGQHLRRIFALLLQLFAGFSLLSVVGEAQQSAFFNSVFFGVLMITLCAGFSSYLLSREFADRRPYEAGLSPGLLYYGLLWLYGGYQAQIVDHTALLPYHSDLWVGLTIITIAVLTGLARRLSWPSAGAAAVWMFLPLLLAAAKLLIDAGHPTQNYGGVLWPLALALYFLALNWVKLSSESVNRKLHVLTTGLAYLLLLWEGQWQALLGGAILSVLFYWLYRRWQWQRMRACALLLLPLMFTLIGLCLLSLDLHPLQLPDNAMGLSWSNEPGLLLWPLGFAVLYGVLYLSESDRNELTLLPSLHNWTLFLAVLLLTWETTWHLNDYFDRFSGWNLAALAIPTIVVMWMIMRLPAWPFRRYYSTYMQGLIPVLVGALLLWTLATMVSPALASPLPWLPLFNPAELLQIMVFITMITLVFSASEQLYSKDTKQAAYTVIATLIFIWLNFVLLRTLHHWGGLTWSISLWRQPLTQTCLSIFWTLTGLSLTVFATRRQVRKLWLTGAALLTVVVIKLALLDMASSHTIERIVSFISVGILLMLIGYFAPLPPALKEQDDEAEV